MKYLDLTSDILPSDILTDDTLELNSIFDFSSSPSDPSGLEYTGPVSLQSLDDEEVYLPGTLEYRKARKRRQNRESAARSRARKKIECSKLDVKIQKLQLQNHTLELENTQLKTENEMLKKELEFYRGIINNPPPQQMKAARTGLLGVSAVMVICVLCFVLPGTGRTGVNQGSRKLLFEGSDDNYEAAYIFAGIGILAFGIWKAFFSQKPQAAPGI